MKIMQNGTKTHKISLKSLFISNMFQIEERRKRKLEKRNNEEEWGKEHDAFAM